MALKLNEKYPGYMNAPSVDYPQGSFKNRTSPTSEDGSYFEQDWANDQQGFFQSLLSKAGVTANGNVDKVGASQYFDALISGNRATDAETSAGVVDDKFITPKKLKLGFAASFATNGYVSFPTWMGGFIIQWGSFTTSASSGVSVFYPISFPNNVFSVVFSATSIVSDGGFIGGADVGKSGFTASGWFAANLRAAISGRFFSIGN